MRWQLRYTSEKGDVNIAETPDVDASIASRMLSACLKSLRGYPVTLQIINEDDPAFVSIAPRSERAALLNQGRSA
jgi:hypothetical protein